MSWKFERVVFDYMEGIKPGELVLLEYTSKEPVHLLLYEVLRYAKLKEVPLIMIDVFDRLTIMRTKLKLMDIDTDLLDNVPVVKVGGSAHVGNIITKVEEIEELSIFRRRFMEVLEKVRENTGNKAFIRIVVGTTELLQQMEKDTIRREKFFAGIVRPLVGNLDTRGLVLINRKRVMKTGLREAEELSTRVLRTGIENGKLVIEVVKSIHFDEYGARISVDPCSLKEYLISGAIE